MLNQSNFNPEFFLFRVSPFMKKLVVTKMMCERPPRSLREIALFSPSVRGRAAEGGRGSLTHHLELQLSNTAIARFPPKRGKLPRSCGTRFGKGFGNTRFTFPLGLWSGSFS